jgi:ribosomal protein S27E
MTKKGEPERRTIGIHCLGCRALLYRYRKGGSGGLVKCFVERIVEDRTAGDLRCPSCGQEFARERSIGGRAVHKIIQGKVFTRGMLRR